ncbi:MAG TPA: glycosyltransferase family 87 protein [Anaerolineales bacterium]|nr:glycosyltransferase family 87 protein [Anaerolineales bacterium]
MQKSRTRRIFVVAGILSLLVSYLGIWTRFINNPTERTGSDFIAFYTAGRIARQEGTQVVYNPSLQQQIQQEVVGFPLVPGQVLLYNHLPFLIPVLQLIVNADYVASFYRWILLLGICYVAGLILLSQMLIQQGIDRVSTVLAALGAFLFLPVFFSFMNGQDTAILFLGLSLWMYGLSSDREYLAGLGLALATVRPHIALVLAIPMLFYSIRVFGAFVIGSGILAFFSLFILGAAGTREFIHILSLSAGGEWYGMKENVMFNLIGLLTRTLPQYSPVVIRMVGWLSYGVSIVGLCLLWSKGGKKQSLPVGLSVILALIFAPHLHFHDLALLLIPIYGWILQSHESGKLGTPLAILAPIAVSLLFLISNSTPYLQYTIPYVVMLGLAAYPYYKGSGTPITTPHRS